MNSSFPTGRRSTMKVEVSCFVGGMVIKEIVHVDKFEDADKVAKSRNPFCRVVNRKVLMKWIKKRKRLSFTLKVVIPWRWVFLLGWNLSQMNTKVFLVDVKKPSTSWEQKSMTEKIDWKQEILDSAKFNTKQENMLKKGAKSLTNTWLLGVLYTRWKQLKSIREQPSPDCSSNVQEWNKKIEDVNTCQSW